MEGVGMTARSVSPPSPDSIHDEPSVLDEIGPPQFSKPLPITQEIAQVVVAGPERLAVQLGERELTAQKAVSCLVSPEVGDRVLCAMTPEGAFILAVLSRAAASPVVLNAGPGDLFVHVPQGRLSLTTRDGVDVATKGEVRLAASELGATVGRAKLYAEEVVALGARAVVEMAQTKLKGSTLESVFERTLSRVKRSFRNVEEVDSLRAGDIDYKAEQSLGLRSQNTVMTAEELIKADAEQIHFG